MENKGQNNDFLFYVPVEVEKGKTDDTWKIRGIASTSDKDSQNEVIVQNGLDLTHLKKGLGFFNWDHHKGVENIIGQVTNAKKVSKGLMVEGYLFKDQPKAKSVKNIMSSLQKGSERRIQMSIEGKVLKRSGKKIVSAKITNVALTTNPINESTYAEFAKSFTNDLSEGGSNESPTSPDSNGSEVSSSASGPFSVMNDKLDEIHDMVKGLSTGNYNAAPSSLSQGAALAKESLDKKDKKIKKYDKTKVKCIYKKTKKAYPELSREELLEVIEKVYDKTQ